ncbi:usg protein [Aestuariivirga sp.]|jgi:uncharacterized protein Usg|uniref:usg protein n=1 Tax=Aestuariivirga sp. TaxID=2650926 RepID=UPI003783D232
MSDQDFARQMAGWSLTTAEITYHMPDYRHLLQSFIWQDYDLAPRFPRLVKFLDFWTQNLDGPLATVRVAHAGILRPVQLRHVKGEWALH